MQASGGLYEPQLLRVYRVDTSRATNCTGGRRGGIRSNTTSSLPGLRGPSPLLRLQSDERLIAMTRRGQNAAFETLCSRYESRLLSFCRHMLNSREDAEDVLQEVFTAAFNAVLADEREINVRPWLYRIARNRSLNHLRRASAIGVDSMDIHFSDHGLSTGDRVIRREGFRELLTDVQHLPETQRTALLLREIDSLSYDQIAHAMETTVPSVKSLLVRARISLAEAAEARKLSCEEVRFELGQVAEGLVKLSPAARRHTRDCERCSSFKKQLKDNNKALAAIFPVGPLLLVKKLLLAKLGGTASGAHVAGGAGATVGAGATAGVGAGAAATGGASVAGGVFTAGAGALATKAVAGLAAAAIVTAGAVAADHSTTYHHHRALAAAPMSPRRRARRAPRARPAAQPEPAPRPPSTRAASAPPAREGRSDGGRADRGGRDPPPATAPARAHRPQPTGTTSKPPAGTPGHAGHHRDHAASLRRRSRNRRPYPPTPRPRPRCPRLPRARPKRRPAKRPPRRRSRPSKHRRRRPPSLPNHRPPAVAKRRTTGPDDVTPPAPGTSRLRRALSAQRSDSEFQRLRQRAGRGDFQRRAQRVGDGRVSIVIVHPFARAAAFGQQQHVAPVHRRVHRRARCSRCCRRARC